MRAWMCASVRACVRACMRASVCACAHPWVCMCMCVHTCMNPRSSPLGMYTCVRARACMGARLHRRGNNEAERSYGFQYVFFILTQRLSSWNPQTPKFERAARGGLTRVKWLNSRTPELMARAGGGRTSGRSKRRDSHSCGCRSSGKSSPTS